MKKNKRQRERWDRSFSIITFYDNLLLQKTFQINFRMNERPLLTKEGWGGRLQNIFRQQGGGGGLFRKTSHRYWQCVFKKARVEFKFLAFVVVLCFKLIMIVTHFIHDSLIHKCIKFGFHTAAF